jgi:signal peptidase II
LPIIKDVFHLTYVENRGAAFGIFQNSQLLFVVIAVAATVVGIYYLHKHKVHIIGKISIVLIISGAIGNMIDRVRIGYVVDFFDFRFIWQYVFNVADIYVVVGTILLCVYLLFIDGKNDTK